MSAGLTNAEVAEVYRTYGHLLLRRCRVILRHDTLAEDALQEVFVRVMRYGQGLATADSRLRWLYRVADNCCYDLLKRQKRRLEEPPERAANAAGPDPGPGIEIRDAVLGFLHRLGPKDQPVAVLAFVDEMTQGEIAAELGLSRPTVNKRLQRIRARAHMRLRGLRG